MRRSIVTCRWGDQTLVGTKHSPDASQVPPGDPIALLLLNSGPAPRAGNSDLSASIADRMASRGMATFRLDLVGLGDSTGISWDDIDSYWDAAQRGANDAAIAAAIEEICERHGVRKVIVGGLCAGAIAGIRGADQVPARIAGLVLLEPNFRASADFPAQAVEPAAGASPQGTGGRRRSRLRRWASRLLHPTEVLYHLTGDSRLARPFRPVRPLLERTLSLLVGRALPSDALTAAVLAWRRILVREVPSFVVVAGGGGTDRYMERIQRTLPAIASGLVRQALILDTNHIFTAGDARRQATDLVEAWITERFPLAVWASRADTAGRPSRPLIARSAGLASAQHTAPTGAAPPQAR